MLCLGWWLLMLPRACSILTKSFMRLICLISDCSSLQVLSNNSWVLVRRTRYLFPPSYSSSVFCIYIYTHIYMYIYCVYIHVYIYTYIYVHILEKAVALHSSTLAWRIPWVEEPGGLQSMGLLRVRHNWATSLFRLTFMHWRRKWQPTPVFLPGESQGRGSLVGCRLWGCTESDTTEAT